MHHFVNSANCNVLDKLILLFQKIIYILTKNVYTKFYDLFVVKINLTHV